ncbi:MAG: TIGR04255 family protein [wastewater metagenome]|nr:TIGR04255 family protein [Candidatus Loosdrechtia aerotolerans]
MNKYYDFPNNPIIEALLDIQVKLPEGTPVTQLESFHEKIRKYFPEKQQRISTRSGITLMPEAATLPNEGVFDGYFLQSPDKKKIIQVRLDGFTYNKLKPYKDWEEFRNEAQALWNLYFQITTPVRIMRIALRYINRVEIPLPLKDIKEYLSTAPEIAPELPQIVNYFFMRLVIPNTDIQAVAVINQTLEGPTDDNKLPVIFDIDVFRDVDYTDNRAEIWTEFEKLHIFKNDIFFHSITEKTKELLRQR